MSERGGRGARADLRGSRHSHERGPRRCRPSYRQPGKGARYARARGAGIESRRAGLAVGRGGFVAERAMQLVYQYPGWSPVQPGDGALQDEFGGRCRDLLVAAEVLQLVDDHALVGGGRWLAVEDMAMPAEAGGQNVLLQDFSDAFLVRTPLGDDAAKVDLDLTRFG